MRTLVAMALLPLAFAQERQLTSSPRNHLLDNNDNYSADNRFLCFDTRVTEVLGNGSSASIMKVDVRSGAESIVYAPKPIVQDPVHAAPGVIAASYNPAADEIVFIHGPFVGQGFYEKTDRRGAVVDAAGKLKFLDARDVTSTVTPPGAHRGGTHRHEFSHDGQRVGFTYDDQLLPQYGRTVGMLVPHKKAPGGATHWFTILVPVVPEKDAQPGDLVSAAYDSWVGPQGLMRAFIGHVKEKDGSYKNSLFVVDTPAHLDVTTATAGTRSNFPAPPAGIKIRRLTQDNVSGIVRGSPDGRRIAYVAGKQIWLINADGTNPVQATHFENGTEGSVRWHPSGDFIASFNDHGVAVTCVKPGARFGETRMVTSHGPGLAKPEGLVWSNDGQQVAFNRRVPGIGKDAAGLDFFQIFTAPFDNQ